MKSISIEMFHGIQSTTKGVRLKGGSLKMICDCDHLVSKFVIRASVMLKGF